MEIGIDSFAKKTLTNEGGTVDDDAKAMSELIERIVHADKVGIDVFGLGEHHREEFLDSAAHNILSAAAAKTQNIRLTSAVAVISAKILLPEEQMVILQWIGASAILLAGVVEIIFGYSKKVT